jgi:hypothetical protein
MILLICRIFASTNSREDKKKSPRNSLSGSANATSTTQNSFAPNALMFRTSNDAYHVVVVHRDTRGAPKQRASPAVRARVDNLHSSQRATKITPSRRVTASRAYEAGPITFDCLDACGRSRF